MQPVLYHVEPPRRHRYCNSFHEASSPRTRLRVVFEKHSGSGPLLQPRLVGAARERAQVVVDQHNIHRDMTVSKGDTRLMTSQSDFNFGPAYHGQSGSTNSFGFSRNIWVIGLIARKPKRVTNQPAWPFINHPPRQKPPSPALALESLRVVLRQFVRRAIWSGCR